MKRVAGKIVGLPGNTEDWLQLAAQGAELGLWYWDEVRQKLDWDLKTCEMFGVPSDGKITLQTFTDALHPDDRDRVMQHWRHCLENGVPYSIDMRSVRPDGSVRWIDARGKSHYGKNGEPICMVGAAFDITDRKLTEQHLARANERLHLAMESGSVGGWDYDVKTGMTVLFGKAHAQLGMSPDETSGSREDFWDQVHEDDLERYRSAIAAAREKREHFDEEFRVVWRDGTIHWVRARGRYYYAADGEPERLLGISSDITERKQAEQVLRENEQRLRLATQVGRMYAYQWDVLADAVTRGSEHVKILGLTEPLRSPQQQFVDKIHPDDRQKFFDAVAGLTPENPAAEVTYRVPAPDGTLGWLRSNGRGFFDAKGRLVRVIGMVTDITDQKLAEEALLDMTRKLVEAQEHERTRIARELHDDINQRLALLAVALEQLQENPSEVRSRLQEIKEEINNISIDVHAVAHDLHSSKLEYLGVAAGMKSWCREFAEREKIEIECRFDMQSTLPSAIGLCLFRVLQQAVQNATKHSGVKRIEVQLHEESGEIHLIVSDSGEGFDVEKALRGKGLGLISMKERVRLLNGTITIQSKQMRGTNVHVRFPL
jgi:PAS domain S-box-containing protein